MTLASIPLLDIWHALGGGPLRGKRGKAFWRQGDGYNIALNTDKNVFFDFRNGIGGGVLDLVQTVLGSDRAVALKWLGDNWGLNPLRNTVEVRRAWRDRQEAEHFGHAMRALAEKAIETTAPNRSTLEFTRLLKLVHEGGEALLSEYRAWMDAWPELATGMVRAGREHTRRVQVRLANFVVRMGLEGVVDAA